MTSTPKTREPQDNDFTNDEQDTLLETIQPDAAELAEIEKAAQEIGEEWSELLGEQDEEDTTPPTPDTTTGAAETSAAGFDEMQAAQMLSIHHATLRSVFHLKRERDFVRLFNAYVVRQFVDANRLLSRVNFELETARLQAQDAATALRKTVYGTGALDFDTNACKAEHGDPLPGFDTATAEGHTLTRFLRLTLTRDRCLNALFQVQPLYTYLRCPENATSGDVEYFEDCLDEWLCESPLLESVFAAVNGENLNEEDVWMLFEAWQQQFDESVKEVFDEELFAHFIEETEGWFHFQARGVTFDDCVHGMLHGMPHALPTNL